jgi:TPP-dependent pyruvate/acetoin dehydrogenase alpha subunit
MAADADLDDIYRSLYRIRRVEERIADVYATDKIKSPVHLSIGQEAVAVGVCAALAKQDTVFGTYRCHAAYLARGGSLRAMIAELYGKSTGCAHGKGGSMHLIDPDVGFMGASAVVGTTIANAVGYAYACRVLGRSTVVVSFFGDGAVEEGVFHESLNFAALHRLPILFVCENNRYAIHTHQDARQAVPDIRARAASYGVVSIRIDESDTLIIRDAAALAVENIRNGSVRPAFLECMTYRWREHVGPGDDQKLGYRPGDELARWLAADDVTGVGRRLEPGRRLQIDDEVEAEIGDAFAFAEASPEPEPSELFTDVFGDP